MNPCDRPVALTPPTDLAAWLVECASGLAPPIYSERLREEWLADLSERHHKALRVSFALQCFWAAVAIRQDHSVPQVSDDRGVAVTPSRPAIRHVMASKAHRADPLHRAIAATPAGVAIVSDINVTPLIDVMLVLLVTLIMTLPMMTHAVKIELPQPQQTPTHIPPEVIDLDIDADGTPVWNGAAVHDFSELERYFQSVARQSPQPEIQLRPNPHVKYDFVAKVLAAAQRNQVAKIGFANTRDFEP